MPRVRHAVVSSALVAALSAVAVARTPKEIETEIDKLRGEFDRQYVASDTTRPKFRKAIAPAAVPNFTQRLALWKELAAISPAQAKRARWQTAKTQARLAFYGQDDAKAALEQQAGGADSAAALPAKLAQQLMAWWEADGNADEQGRVLDAAAEIAKAQPKDDVSADALRAMIDDNPATPALAGRAWDAIATLTSPAAKAYTATPNKVGKPLPLSGPLVTGKPFDLKQYKGKVVLIDFWATWCPPCREELPRISKLYAEYHDKGFEIVGVSSDQAKRDLVEFLKQHPEMPWPQMFAGGPAWHPLTKRFGIGSIPTMYLVDRNGVLRTVEARSSIEKDLPELLAEQPVEPAHASAAR